MKAELPYSSNSGVASAELKHSKICSFSHRAMQNLGGVTEVIRGRTNSLAVWVGTQKDTEDITGQDCMSRDNSRGRNGFYKLLLQPKPSAECSHLASLGMRSTWGQVKLLPSCVALAKSFTPPEC